MTQKNSLYAKKFLNKIIKVKIDRPLGSKHPKYDWIYPINYGYLPDTQAPDKEEIDAYILGVSEPVNEFTGKVIAIIHRINDNDDKLVLASGGKEYSDQEIKKATNFQEQYYKSKIIREL